ncbi:MAG: sugar phosphate nucleotidyltransferase [Pseudomonas sp.]|uniref:sugar phosphate nucleotidyltransferase n=1 Tax=Pseudomonas sp. TaxID=306 RepID=UPI003399B3DC
MSPLIPCILAGGAGTRLWPVSREALPKPFMRVAGGDSLLQRTFRQAIQLKGVSQLLTVTHRDLLFSTLDHYRALKPGALALDFVLEACNRNTAPAIIAAALQVARQQGPDSLLLVLPADHLIDDPAAFARAVDQARHLAEQGQLVCFGLPPAATANTAALAPTASPAPHGTGLFCMKVDSLLHELQLHAPELLGALEDCLARSHSLSGPQARQCELHGELFGALPDLTLEQAVLDRSSRTQMLPCTFGWRGIDSWQALGELTAADTQGNRVQGATVLHQVNHCHIHGSERLIGAVGVEHLLIVDTADALLIADARRSQDVQHLTRLLKQSDHACHRLPSTVARPWGNYRVLEEGPWFKIKRILVHPGASLSLQLHHHRSEHWIVVNGTARVTNGEAEFLLNTNQSTFIPAGHRHRLSNPGVVDLVIIEVQSGEYLGEDDIVRFNDLYGRVPLVEEPA